MQSKIALMNPGGICNDLDAGDITSGEIYGIQPCGNQLIKLKLTGQHVRDILNQQWQKDILSIGLTNGEEIIPSKTYSVVANAFLASGGDGFVSFKNGKDAETGPTDFEALVDFIKKSKEPIQPIIDGRIQKIN